MKKKKKGEIQYLEGEIIRENKKKRKKEKIIKNKKAKGRCTAVRRGQEKE
jgi:hypothetical protein